MAIEIEKKYRVTAAQVEALRARLALVGAEAHGTEFEVNTLYAGHGLDPRVCVLRLRRVGARALLTYKEREASAAPIKHQREDEPEVGKSGVAQELAEAGAAYAGAGDVQKRRREGEGEPDTGPADEAQKDAG